MNFTVAELTRRLSNIIRAGTVAEVDAPNARVRVQIGAILTAPLPWLTARAGTDRTWWAPSVGEQVLVLSPDGELASGWVLPGAYTQAAPAPSSNPAIHRTTYRDGAVVEYDTGSHTLTVSGVAQVVVSATAAVTITAPSTVVNGNFTVNGDTTLNGPLAQGMGSNGGTAAMQGPLTVVNDVIGSGVSLDTHVHGGVMPGGGTTGAPQ